MAERKPAVCLRCGMEWPYDPALDVKCPQCQAPKGVNCRRPSGHNCELHIARDRAALDAGVIIKCTGDQSTHHDAQAEASQLKLM